MADLLDRFESSAPDYGIRPIPPPHRTMTGVDFAILWGDLGVGLLVLVTGALLSGLAGVAGVYVIAQAPAFLGPLTADGPAAAAAPRKLDEVYNLTRNQLALFVAAVFGLAPSTLTARLQAQVDRLERDLQRSEPATSTSRGGPTSSDEEGS